MYHHLLRLIDNNNVRVLVQDIEGNLLRFDLRLPGIRHRNLKAVSNQEPVTCFHRLPIHHNILGFYEFLHIGPGTVRHCFSEITVNPLPLLALYDEQFFQGLPPYSRNRRVLPTKM